MNRLAACVVMGFSAAGISAATYTVSDVPGRGVFASGDTVSAETEAIGATLPEVSCEPSFHLDASRTENWTVDETGNSVTRIPSLAGSRYLFVRPGDTVTGMSARNPDGTMWDNNDYWAVGAPVLEKGALNGMDVLDFGPMNSRRGMVFDREGDGEGGSTTNQLRNIGTVVAVWDSSQGGGMLLAGGVGMSNGSVNPGMMWVRGAPFTYCGMRMDNGTEDASCNSYVTTFEKWSSVLWCTGSRTTASQCAYIPAVNGVLRLDGAEMIPWLCGFNGGWEVVSLTPSEAGGVANGLGLGVLTQNKGNLSGGMKIAEMIIYPELLSVFEIAKVEEYLAAKWLGRVPYGKGGKARLAEASVPSAATSAGSVLALDVPGETELVTCSLDYGRGKDAALRKIGDGVLELSGAHRFAGTVEVAGGTLRIPAKKIPSSVPCEPFFVIDASDKATYEDHIRVEGGTNFVDRVRSAVAVNYRSVNPSPLCATRNSEDSKVPFLVEDVFGTAGGKRAPAFDFWDTAPNGNSSSAGGFWRIAFSDAPTSYPVVRGATTMIALVKPRFSGGTILGGVGAAATDSESSTGCYFERSQQKNSEGTSRLSGWRRPLLGTEPFTRIHDTLTPTNGMTMIDGTVRDPADGFASPGWQVVAIQVPGSYVQCIGTTYNSNYAGGFMLAELALYNHALTEEEMRDVSAYMAAKWLGRSLAGYERTAAELARSNLQSVSLSEGAAVEVPAGTVARIGKLSASGAFTVKGGGLLEIESGSFDPDSVTVAGGSCVKRVRKKVSDDICRVADFASMHLDAEDRSSMYICSSGPTSYVRSWEDKAKGNVALAKGAYDSVIDTGMPYLADGGNYSTPGRTFVNFGGYASGKTMNFLKPLHGVRVAYVVRVSTCASGSRGIAGGVLLGENGDHSGSFDFLCAGNNNGHPAKPFALEAHSVTSLPGFEVYTNGVKVASPGSFFYSPDNAGIPETLAPVLFELHLPAGAHVSALSGAKNESKYTGCQAIGEVILYERELSETEIVQTRNYLMRKWFGKTDAELSPLPEAEEDRKDDLRVFDGLTVEGGDVAEMSGQGTLEKTGDGVLSLDDFHSFTGTVAVKSGTLRLAKPIPAREPLLPARDRILARFDASSGVTLNASSQVESWRCAEGSGWSVAPSNSNKAVYEYADGLNGRGIVNICKNTHIKMQFKNPAGEWDDIEEIGSVLWLIGSQDGGGFLLGGCVGNSKNNFHRAAKPGTSSYGDNIDDPLLYAGAANAVRTAEFHVNGVKVDPSKDGLSGGWDVVTMRRADNYPDGTSAGGLAWCNSVSDRNGSQRVAEIVVYKGRISEAERDDGVYYLRTKWGLDGEFQKSISNRLAVVLDDGAVLDMNGADQYVDVFVGTGEIVNGGTLGIGTLIADFSCGDYAAFGGKLSFRPGFKIELRSAGVRDAAGFLPLVSVSEIEGGVHLRNADFTGDVGMLEKYRIRPVVADGVLGLKVAPRAMSIIVR